MPQLPADAPKADPTSSGLRARNIEARRQRILRAARLLMSEGGIGALSMRKLALKASLSVNTLYNLWGTREEILRALTVDASEKMEASLPIEESPEDPVAHCLFLVSATVRLLCEHAELVRPMILAWLEGTMAGQSTPVEPMQRSIDRIARLIEMAREQGLVAYSGKSQQIAWQIQHGSQFAFIQWALGRIDDDHFEARALYGANLAFLGLVPADRKGEIEQSLARLESRLRRPAAPSRVSSEAI